jgi:type III secretion protein J
MKTLIALLAALALTACTKQVELMSNIPEREANEVMAALQNAGIQADKTPGKEGMVTLAIEADKVGRAVDLLRSKGLPHARYEGMGQVFKKEGLISSPVEERARYLFALSQELGATLSQIDGVMIARVHVVLPERGAVGDPTMPSSAAVFIKHQDGYNLDVLQPQIRRLVGNAIPGLTSEKISIVLFNSMPVTHKPVPREPETNKQFITIIAAVLGVVALLAALLGWRILRSRGAAGAKALES